jgi:hypothetical protein
MLQKYFWWAGSESQYIVGGLVLSHREELDMDRKLGGNPLIMSP